jgi:hypothetical protein
MATIYRIIVSCDEKAVPDCHGFFEVSGAHLFGDERVLPKATERGWLRGYGATHSYDVCPACRKLVEERLPAPAPEKGLTDS